MHHEILSPLRRTLCSRANAMRIAARMQTAGTPATILLIGDPLRPWRVVETADLSPEETRRCA